MQLRKSIPSILSENTIDLRSSIVLGGTRSFLKYYGFIMQIHPPKKQKSVTHAEDPIAET